MTPWFTGERCLFSHTDAANELRIAQAADDDLAERMQEAEGKLFWASAKYSRPTSECFC